jgi:hypothetical protein
MADMQVDPPAAASKKEKGDSKQRFEVKKVCKRLHLNDSTLILYLVERCIALGMGYELKA